MLVGVGLVHITTAVISDMGVGVGHMLVRSRVISVVLSGVVRSSVVVLVTASVVGAGNSHEGEDLEWVNGNGHTISLAW